ncbi:hypothetical protein C8Q80DRAFT_1215052 [Daedaleopsis nitida]|nr:hypothetical protein C8Q80DRAFT_1215052 [Daedaleopsis nitida]
MPQAHWFSLSKTPFLARSSHCIAVTESGIILARWYSHGSLHVFDLARACSRRMRMLTPDTKLLAEARCRKAIPVPRGGSGHAPLDAYQAGVWKATVHSAQGPLQSNEDEAPEPRSYHTAVAHGYPARGGTVLVAAALAEETSVLLRYGGFCGHELPAAGEVDIYVVSQDKWVTVQPTADPAHGSPGPRSLANAVAVVYHGERARVTPGTPPPVPGGDILAGWAWQRLDVVSEDDDHFPEGRGESKVVMFGGLLSDNSRSDELWELEIN